MKRVVIIQARMTSTRLPGKVLADLAGKPMLAQQIRRLEACQAVDEILVATTTNQQDDPIVELARQSDIGWFRGDEHDVLARFAGAARQCEADVVVRVTSDCPLIDPHIVDQVVGELTLNDCDYASNVMTRSYPRGLDVEAFYADTLRRVDRLAKSAAAREHVTPFIYAERPDLFIRREVIDTEVNTDLRWTVDTPADLEAVRLIYDGLGLGERIAPYQEVLAYVRAHPEISRINADIETWSPRS